MSSLLPSSLGSLAWVSRCVRFSCWPVKSRWVAAEANQHPVTTLLRSGGVKQGTTIRRCMTARRRHLVYNTWIHAQLPIGLDHEGHHANRAFVWSSKSRGMYIRLCTKGAKSHVSCARQYIGTHRPKKLYSAALLAKVAGRWEMSRISRNFMCQRNAKHQVPPHHFALGHDFSRCVDRDKVIRRPLSNRRT